MNVIEVLKKEHRDIERELLELEGILQDSIEGVINYPNLLHTCEKLHELWNLHELREERIFPVFKRERIVIPVKTMMFEHRKLKKHKDALNLALESGSDAKIRRALEGHVRIIIKELREHINYEDEVLYRITLEIFSDEELREM